MHKPKHGKTFRPGPQPVPMGKAGEAEAFRLFTHVVTHEFHDKGQILSLTRHLGFVPVDTDVMR